MTNVSSVVEKIKTSESKFVVRGILNLLSAKFSLNDLINDLENACSFYSLVAPNKKDEAQIILESLLALASNAQVKLKKEERYASVW